MIQKKLNVLGKAGLSKDDFSAADTTRVKVCIYLCNVLGKAGLCKDDFSAADTTRVKVCIYLFT